MKAEEKERFIRRCVLGVIGGVLMAAGDWLLGCIPLERTDTGMFNRAYYLSGAYGLWRPVLIVGRGAVGSFLYYFMVTALNADIDAKHKKAKRVQRLCGIFTVTAALAIHLWSATLAWFTAYPGPRVGAETAVTAVTAYQEDMLLAILPMYIPMVPTFGIHFVMLLIGRTRYPRRMLIFHPVTWMSVMSQSSTNTAIVIRRTAAAIYEKKEARHRCHDASILKDEGYGHSVTVLLAAVKTHAARIHRISGAPLDVSTVSIPFPPPNLYCKDAELNPKTGLLCVFASGFCMYSVLRPRKEIKNISLHLEQNPPLHAGSGDFRSTSRHLTVLGAQKRNTPPKGFRSA